MIGKDVSEHLPWVIKDVWLDLCSDESRRGSHGHSTLPPERNPLGQSWRDLPLGSKVVPLCGLSSINHIR